MLLVDKEQLEENKYSMEKLNNDELDYLIKYLENRGQSLCDSVIDSIQQLSNWLTYEIGRASCRERV